MAWACISGSGREIAHQLARDGMIANGNREWRMANGEWRMAMATLPVSVLILTYCNIAA